MGMRSLDDLEAPRYSRAFARLRNSSLRSSICRSGRAENRLS